MEKVTDLNVPKGSCIFLCALPLKRLLPPWTAVGWSLWVTLVFAAPRLLGQRWNRSVGIQWVRPWGEGLLVSNQPCYFITGTGSLYQGVEAVIQISWMERKWEGGRNSVAQILASYPNKDSCHTVVVLPYCKNGRDSLNIWRYCSWGCCHTIHRFHSLVLYMFELMPDSLILLLHPFWNYFQV